MRESLTVEIESCVEICCIYLKERIEEENTSCKIDLNDFKVHDDKHETGLWQQYSVIDQRAHDHDFIVNSIITLRVHTQNPFINNLTHIHCVKCIS